MFCNVSVNNRETNILIHSDAAYIVLMVLFGISNGYIGNIAMMFGPGTVKDPKYGVSAVSDTSISGPSLVGALKISKIYISTSTYWHHNSARTLNYVFVRRERYSKQK